MQELFKEGIGDTKAEKARAATASRRKGRGDEETSYRSKRRVPDYSGLQARVCPRVGVAGTKEARKSWYKLGS